MNTQSHFAKYIGKEIYKCDTNQEVTLMGIREDVLQFMNGNPEEQEGLYSNFRIIVQDDMEVIKNNIPIDLAVVITKKTEIREPVKVNPEMFLEKLKDKLYPPLGVTHEQMVKSQKHRKRTYVLVRQIIMASYYCAFENHPIKEFRISMAESGGIYGKDHATVSHAIKTVNNLLDTNKHFYSDYKDIWGDVKLINSKSKLNIYNY